MKLTFLGTRGNIKPKTKKHKRHTSLLISYKNKNVIIDRGEDWLNENYDFKADGIVITHSHPDHIGGLKNGAPCKVYATDNAIKELKKFKSLDLWEIKQKKSFSIKGISFIAYPVEHSLIAPAVGYKISAGRAVIFYVPDLVYIYKREKALKNVKVYIGDGATVSRPLIRKRNDNLIGHTTVSTQISWCEKENVLQAVITHCGSEIIKSNEKKIKKKLNEIRKQHGVKVQLAYDGMEMILR